MTNDQLPHLDDDAVREHVRTAICVHGLRGTALRLGVHAQTILALAAGIKVSKGSFAIVREHLRRERSAGPSGGTQ